MSRIAAAVLLLITPFVLSGCATSAGSCVDYVSLQTSQARYAAAETVVLATVQRTDRTLEAGAVYPVFRAHVLRTLKGRMGSADVDVINPSDQCTVTGRRAEYVEGDALSSTERAVLYLSSRRSGSTAFRLVVPNAIDAVPAGSSLPLLTAAPTVSPTPTPTPTPPAG